jgi:hypothetical protein
MCDDIAATVEELKAKGVEFATPVTEQGFGLMTRLKLPGGGELGLYEPRHPTAIEVAALRPGAAQRVTGGEPGSAGAAPDRP